MIVARMIHEGDKLVLLCDENAKALDMGLLVNESTGERVSSPKLIDLILKWNPYLEPIDPDASLRGVKLTQKEIATLSIN